MFSKETLAVTKAKLSPLVEDYLNKNKRLDSFYSFYPDLEGFNSAIQELNKRKFSREDLVHELSRQSLLVSNGTSASIANIDKLKSEKTFTVITGHQLCLFTGPLYFIYKIISVINLCEKLKAEFKDFEFVPVYWLASEDHDFEEVNHFNFYGHQFKWESNQTGAVGDFLNENLNQVFEALNSKLNHSENSKFLKSLFEKSYLQHQNLVDATRYLVNELFGQYGLITIDGNSKALKEKFKRHFLNDIFNQESYRAVIKSVENLKDLGYDIQVNPREINCFYLDKGVRSRIEQFGNAFKVVDTEISFSKSELEEFINSSPEKISPNVVLRPLYQQFLFPNLSYVGGPGELAYWLEYKEAFKSANIFYPILTLRKIITIMDANTIKKLEKLGFEKQSIFEDEQKLITMYLEHKNETFDLENYKKSISSLFEQISMELNKIDKTLVASADSEKQKNLKSLENLEQKSIRAIKQKLESELNQIKSIRAKYFPQGIPQERVENFSMYYEKWGPEFLKTLKDNLTYDLKSSDINIIFEN